MLEWLRNVKAAERDGLGFGRGIGWGGPRSHRSLRKSGLRVVGMPGRNNRNRDRSRLFDWGDTELEEGYEMGRVLGPASITSLSLSPSLSMLDSSTYYTRSARQLEWTDLALDNPLSSLTRVDLYMGKLKGTRIPLIAQIK